MDGAVRQLWIELLEYDLSASGICRAILFEHLLNRLFGLLRIQMLEICAVLALHRPLRVSRHARSLIVYGCDLELLRLHVPRRRMVILVLIQLLLVLFLDSVVIRALDLDIGERVNHIDRAATVVLVANHNVAVLVELRTHDALRQAAHFD